jgi:hypothetical protein
MRITGRSMMAALDPVLAAQDGGCGDGGAGRGGWRHSGCAAGEWHAAVERWRTDQALGVRIRNLAAEVSGEGTTVRLVSLSGQAGTGSIAARGTVGLAQVPVQMVTLRKAQLLSSSLVNGAMDADLTLSGNLAERVMAAGMITLGAPISACEHLPPERGGVNGRRPARRRRRLPAAAGGLNDIRAPGELFLRGRGSMRIARNCTLVARPAIKPRRVHAAPRQPYLPGRC